MYVFTSASRKDTIHQLIPDIAQVMRWYAHGRSMRFAFRDRKTLLCKCMQIMTQVPASGSFTPDTLRACIRANFAAGKDAPVDTQGLLLDQAFAALRILSEQMHMQQCSSHAVTGGIQVEVTSAFIGVSIGLWQ